MKPFRTALLRWYRHHGRKNLPWRQTKDPYAILVSEFMLQQTQVATVLPYYERWLRRFPDFRALARASENEVLHAWQGLGYYARARNLHAAAKIVVKRFGGRFPEDVNASRSLPGLGRYTANAVATFAFDQSVPIVDANIARVVARLFNISTPIDASTGREEIWRRAEELVPKSHPGLFNSALMDLGATVCVARTPRCTICPVKSLCRAKNPTRLPVKKPRPAPKRLTERHAFTSHADKILLQQCDKRWRGMWMLPPINSPKGNKAIHSSTFPFTNHQIDLRIFAIPPHGIGPGQRWLRLARLHSIPIPSPHRRAIADILKTTAPGKVDRPLRARC